MNFLKKSGVVSLEQFSYQIVVASKKNTFDGIITEKTYNITGLFDNI